ncbi:hypothetical protein GCM10028787_32810 [Brachybacterium horti]
MRRFNGRRWALSLALEAVASWVMTLGLLLVLTFHATPEGVDLWGAIPYVLPVLAVAGLGVRYATRWGDASLDETPGGAITGHPAWRNALATSAVGIADTSAIVLVLALPGPPWQARALTLTVVATAMLAAILLSLARMHWGRTLRNVLVFCVADAALISLGTKFSMPSSLREVVQLVVVTGLVIAALGLFTQGVAALYRGRRDRNVRGRRAHLMARAHLG